MSSVKCPQCGLVNWVTAEACKRCKLPFAAPTTRTAAPAPTEADEQAAPAAADEAHPPSSAPDAPAETAPGHGEQQQPFLYDARTAQGHAGAGHAHASWRSPYDVGGRGEADVAVNTRDIDFEVAPFIDTTMTVRDTYALSRSQFRLIARVVLAAVAPHALLILAVGTGLGADSPKLPAVIPFFFGASPASPSQTVGNADFAGALSFFLLASSPTTSCAGR